MSFKKVTVIIHWAVIEQFPVALSCMPDVAPSLYFLWFAHWLHNRILKDTPQFRFWRLAQRNCNLSEKILKFDENTNKLLITVMV